MDEASKTPLNLDHNASRALHRIVRAMHDGECPKCHAVHSSRAMRSELGWRCPKCKFVIWQEEADEVFRIFGPFMEQNLAIFEKWRSERNALPDQVRKPFDRQLVIEAARTEAALQSAKSGKHVHIVGGQGTEYLDDLDLANNAPGGANPPSPEQLDTVLTGHAEGMLTPAGGSDLHPTSDEGSFVWSTKHLHWVDAPTGVVDHGRSYEERGVMITQALHRIETQAAEIKRLEDESERLRKAAAGLLGLIDEAGSGAQDDRVFAQFEFDELRAALAAKGGRR